MIWSFLKKVQERKIGLVAWLKYERKKSISRVGFMQEEVARKVVGR